MVAETPHSRHELDTNTHIQTQRDTRDTNRDTNNAHKHTHTHIHTHTHTHTHTGKSARRALYGRIYFNPFTCGSPFLSWLLETFFTIGFFCVMTAMMCELCFFVAFKIVLWWLLRHVCTLFFFFFFFVTKYFSHKKKTNVKRFWVRQKMAEPNVKG